MGELEHALQWIDGQGDTLLARVKHWASINTGTGHREGIERFSTVLEHDLADLGATFSRRALPDLETVDERGEIRRDPTPPALLWEKRPDAARRVLLAIHTDTVFPADHPFQDVEGERGGQLRGPGVADAKAGIAIAATALAALERSPLASKLGWTLLLNPDEEIGSPSSAALLAAEAKKADFGMVFEPALPDGNLIARRKGSGNFSLVVRGRTAHVGREFSHGRSAIHALACAIDAIAALSQRIPGVIANTGWIGGGGRVNVVSDFAMARFNLRVDDAEQMEACERALGELVADIGARREVEITLHGRFQSPPKVPDARTRALMRDLEICAEAIGFEIAWRDSGGVCDGNKLLAAGLANIDTLGAVGSGIHSDQEHLDVSSLIPRSKLSALLLLRYASGSLALPDQASEHRKALR